MNTLDTPRTASHPYTTYIYIYISTHTPARDCDREDASSMATAGATANTTVKNSRASRESGLLCSHSHGESMRLSEITTPSQLDGARPWPCRRPWHRRVNPLLYTHTTTRSKSKPTRTKSCCSRECRACRRFVHIHNTHPCLRTRVG